jgi:integrase
VPARAKRALESGAQITWLSRHLGHSSLKVTTDIYGHWERAERKLQAAKMEGAFPYEANPYSTRTPTRPGPAQK